MSFIKGFISMKAFLAVLMFITFTSTAQVELVTNGGFDTDLSGWSKSGNNVGYSNVFSNGTAVFSAGNQTPDGVINQNINSVNGAPLQVTLNFAKNGSGGGIAMGTFEILNGGTVISTTTLTAPSTQGTFSTVTFSLTSPSDNLTIRFTDQTTNTTALDFHLNTVSITVPDAYPVNFLSFDVYKKAEDKSVLLLWTTSHESNNDYFTVERSSNAIDWEEIAQVKGTNNSEDQSHYQYFDKEPKSGHNYYRIKQTDFNGTATYTKIQSEHIDLEEVLVYPNPANKLVNIFCDFTENRSFQFYDKKGVNVLHKLKTIEQSEDNLILDISLLPSGTYFFKHKGLSTRIVKP